MTKKLSDVAEFAGVSVATVRRVLNDKPGISLATRAAVLTALDVFGLDRPERFRAGQDGLVGLVVPDLQNPIFPAMVEAVSIGLVKLGLMPVLCTRTADGVSEANYIELLLRRDVAGIVFIGASYADAGPQYGRELRERKVPMVLINAADENDVATRISVDDAVAADMALAHLASLGHERIGLILGPVGHVPSARKLGAYVRRWELAGHGGPSQGGTGQGGTAQGGAGHVGAGQDAAAAVAATAVATTATSTSTSTWRNLVVHVPFSMEGGSAGATRLLSEGVTALVCASDALALGAIRAARRQGLTIPGDLSVVGFDDSAYMIAVEPPLTTLRQPVRAMGSAAVKLLDAQINGHVVLSEELLLEPELIVRASTGPRGR